MVGGGARIVTGGVFTAWARIAIGHDEPEPYEKTPGIVFVGSAVERMRVFADHRRGVLLRGTGT